MRGGRSSAKTGSALQLANEPTNALAKLYVRPRARCSRRGDQMVIGAASTASSGGGMLRSARGEGYGEKRAAELGG